jgi:16S rRNA (cytosine967-C5)-methyltransferase
MKEQIDVIDNASTFVREEGILIYVTCSLLPEENDDQIAAFLTRNPGFATVELGSSAAFKAMPTLGKAVRKTRYGQLLSPLRTGTDGFYISAMRRVAG